MSEYDLLTLSEVAKILRFSERTTREFIRRGELPAAKIGSSFRIKRSDVEALINKQVDVEEKAQEG